MVVRYKTSPALFGPLYLADSLTGFWSETWHNAFASPCTSLVYGPLRYGASNIRRSDINCTVPWRSWSFQSYGGIPYLCIDPTLQYTSLDQSRLVLLSQRRGYSLRSGGVGTQEALAEGIDGVDF